MFGRNQLSDKDLQKTVNQRLQRAGIGSQSRIAATVQGGMVTLTGLGLKIAGLIVALAGGSLFFTVLFSAIAGVGYMMTGQLIDLQILATELNMTCLIEVHDLENLMRIWNVILDRADREGRPQIVHSLFHTGSVGKPEWIERYREFLALVPRRGGAFVTTREAQQAHEALTRGAAA